MVCIAAACTGIGRQKRRHCLSVCYLDKCNMKVTPHPHPHPVGPAKKSRETFICNYVFAASSTNVLQEMWQNRFPSQIHVLRVIRCLSAKWWFGMAQHTSTVSHSLPLPFVQTSIRVPSVLGTFLKGCSSTQSL